MEESEVDRAVAAARQIASAHGLLGDTAIVLHNSNKLTLRLTPGDVLARVAPEADQIAHFEVDLAQRLATVGSPVAVLDPRVEPRVYERDGFVVTFWTYYPSVTAHDVSPAEYGVALEQLHAAMRTVDIAAPHFTDRVTSAQELVADRHQTPALTEADRELLGDTLRDLRRALTGRGVPDQLLHGEPHPGNLLATANGLIFIDLETCCRGPVEFDLAHAPVEVAAHYPGIDQDVLSACRTLVLAMITAWRWDRDDQFPDGSRLAVEWLGQLRATRPPEAGIAPSGGSVRGA